MKEGTIKERMRNRRRQREIRKKRQGGTKEDKQKVADHVVFAS